MPGRPKDPRHFRLASGRQLWRLNTFGRPRLVDDAAPISSNDAKHRSLPSSRGLAGRPRARPARRLTALFMMPGRDSKPDAKQHWQQVWSDNYEALTERLLEATSANKTQYGRCPCCHTMVPLPHPDTRARTDAIAKLHELAGLRPKPDDGGAATGADNYPAGG